MTEITVKASDYLIQQYKDGESLPSVVNLHSDRLMEVADSIATLPLSTLSVDTAEGVQLDKIGEIVDAGRGLLTDSQYRIDITFMQTVNSAGGNAAIIIDYIKWYCGPYFSTMFLDEWNASVNIQLVTSGTLPTGFMEELVYQLSRIVPAAVEVRLFHSADGDIFAVADEGTDNTPGGGFSEEDNDTSITGTLYTTRTTGGQFVDPIRI